MRVIAWICLGFICFILLALCIYLAVGAILFKHVFARKSLSKKLLKKNIDKKLKENKIDLGWWDKQKTENVTIQSEDGLKLFGSYIGGNSNKTCLIVHGFGWNHQQMQQYCKMFRDRNYNILAIDCRAHGRSEGKCVGFGWLDRLDIKKWVEWLNEKTPDNKIILFGLSMGGSAVCMSAGEKLKNVVGIISDCAFANASKEIEYVMKKQKIPFRKLLKKHLFDYTKRLHFFEGNQADATKMVKNTEVPILFIHGLDDDYVPIENLKILHSATPIVFREKYEVEGATHAMAYVVDGVMYEKRVFDFIKKRTPLI